MKLQLKRSNVLESSAAKEPTASQLEYGELAINYNTNDPAIFLKDSNNNVIRISGIGNIADDGQVELPASNTPPLNPQPGNLWYNSEDGRLYIYYQDPDTEQWVDASPDSWDPSSYPDVTDDEAQAGTLDDRYLMLNTANDPLTGGLIIQSGNVGIGTSSPIARLQVQSSSADAIRLDRNVMNGTSYLNINSDRTNADSFLGGVNIEWDNTKVVGIRGKTGPDTANKNDGELVFETASAGTVAERMRINKDGKVGIGTDDPQTQLHLLGQAPGGGNNGGILVEDSTTTGASPAVTVIGKRSDGNTGYNFSGKLLLSRNRTSQQVNANCYIGTVGFGGNHTNNSKDNILYAASIHGRSEGSFNSATDMPTALTFNTGSTGENGTASNKIIGQERMRIDSSGNVGIGTSAPDKKLHIQSGGSNSDDNLLRFEIASPVTNDMVLGGLEFEHQDSTSPGVKGYYKCFSEDGGTDVYHAWGVSGGTTVFEALRITSRGNVGIGTDSPDYPLDIGGKHARIGDGTTTGIIQYGSSSNAVNNFHLGASNGIFRLWNGDIGSGTEILRINSTGGVSWDNGANFLDDYEEGEWTPSFSIGTFTYAFQEGRYTKVGDLVTASCYVKWSAVSGSGALKVNLPFASGGNVNVRYSGAVGYCVGVDNGGDRQIIASNTGGNSTISLFVLKDNASPNVTNVSNLSANGEVQLSLTYKAA